MQKRLILDGFFTIPDHVSPFAQRLVNSILKLRHSSAPL